MKALLLFTIIGAFLTTALGETTGGFLEVPSQPMEQVDPVIEDETLSAIEDIQTSIDEKQEIRENALRAGMYGGTGLCEKA